MDLSPDPFVLPRAGFWRRVIAFTIDSLIVGVIIAVLGTLAFSLSRGRVQTAPFALTTSTCLGLNDIPPGLSPPPPDNSNHASLCTSGSFPGLPMQRALVVGRYVSVDGGESDVSRSYPLDADDSTVDAFDVTWVGQLGFLAYLAAALCLRGRTAGMRVLRIRLVVLSDPERSRVPLPAILVRAAVAVGGLLPAVAIGGYVFVRGWQDPEQAPVGLVWLAAIVAMAWILWNAVLIGRKRDPVYDRVARLAVVRA